jgi:hypothetical protein
LFGNQRRDVRLETSCTKTHDYNSHDEASECSVAVLDHPRDSGYDEENVTDECNSHTDRDGLEATPMRVCNVSSKKWNNIHPSRLL